MGLFHSKPLETAFNIFNRFYNLDWSTEYSVEWKTASTAKTFPLLRLPLLALIEVFKSLDPIELFILSKCSRKVTNCVHIVGSKEWKLSVDVGNKQININDKYLLTIFEVMKRKNAFESARNPSWTYEKSWKTFFLEYQNIGDRKLELQKLLSQLQAAFRCPVLSFKYSEWMQNDQCLLSVLKYIIQHQTQPLESLYLCGTFKNKDLKWILQNVRVSRKINLDLIDMDSFTTNFGPTCEQVTIRSSYCLRLDLMMFKSCKYIDLSHFSTVHELKNFMKEWKTGGFPNLQYMAIKKSEISWTDIILGFNRSEMKQLDVKRRLIIDVYISVVCTGGVDIQSDNGTKATMQMDRKSPNSFELFVWNN